MHELLEVTHVFGFEQYVNIIVCLVGNVTCNGRQENATHSVKSHPATSCSATETSEAGSFLFLFVSLVFFKAGAEVYFSPNNNFPKLSLIPVFTVTAFQSV